VNASKLWRPAVHGDRGDCYALAVVADSLLTRRWNNIISAVLGIPLTAYVAWYFSTGAISEFAGFIGMAGFGAAL